MGKRNKNMKLVAKILSLAMITTMMSGYVAPPKEVKADTFNSSHSYEVNTQATEVEAATYNVVQSASNVVNSSDSLEKAIETSTEQSTEITTTEKSTTDNTTTDSSTTNPAETTTKPQETTTEQPTTVDPDAFDLVAHRGYSAYAPENSIPAFEMAVASGFSKIELDIRRCKPDSNGKATWVISHNDSLKNTMGVNVDISDSTYSELLKYSYTKGNDVDAYSNLKIATLDQVIDLIKKYKSEGKKVNWQIELKSVSDSNYPNYFESELVKPLKNAGVEDCVTFISFSKTYLKKIKSIDSTLATTYLSTILDEDAVNDALKCNAEGVTFNGEKNYTKEAAIKLALSKGLKVGVYTLDTPAIMGVYYQWGARSFTTNMVNPNEVTPTILRAKYNTKAFSCTLSKTSYTYDGSRKLPTVTVKYKDIELVEGINYQLSYSDNKNPGTAKVYISGINNCTDERELKYKIVMPKVTGFSDSTTTTSKVTLKWTPVDKITGYIVYRYNYSKKKYEAIKTIANSDAKSYKITKLASATKYRYRVATYLKADGKTYTSSPCTAKTTYTKPAKVTIKSAKRYSKNRRIMVKWTNSPRCTGYEVRVATDKKMKHVVKKYTVSGNTKQYVKVKGLTKIKKYYVKVRAYLKVGKKYYYSSYSAVVKNKPLKIKKKK